MTQFAVSTFASFIQSNKSIQVLRRFLAEWCDLDIYLSDGDGQIVFFDDQTRPPTDTSSLEEHSFTFEELAFDGLPPQFVVDQEILQQAKQSQKPHVYHCTYAHCVKALCPISCHGEVKGFLYIYDHRAKPVNREQFQSIVDMICDTIDRFPYKEWCEQLAPVDTLTYTQKVVKKAVRYIHDNFTLTDLNLQNVATETCISYHYLSRLFKKELDTTFTNYLMGLRIHAAASALSRNKALSVNQISLMAGFDDPSYFCRVFKKKVGCTPEKYRKLPNENKLKIQEQLKVKAL